MLNTHAKELVTRALENRADIMRHDATNALSVGICPVTTVLPVQVPMVLSTS